MKVRLSCRINEKELTIMLTGTQSQRGAIRFIGQEILLQDNLRTMNQKTKMIDSIEEITNTDNSFSLNIKCTEESSLWEVLRIFTTKFKVPYSATTQAITDIDFEVSEERGEPLLYQKNTTQNFQVTTWESVFGKVYQNEIEPSKCYVGVASERYGKPFAIQELCQGKLDASFKSNQLHFSLICHIFDTYNEALENTKRRSVTKDSAYVLEILCPATRLISLIQEGAVTFSELITKVTNVTTLELLSVSHTLR